MSTPVKQLIYHLAHHENAELVQLLARFPLAELAEETALRLEASLLQVCLKVNNKEGILLVHEAYDRTRTAYYPAPPLTCLPQNPYLSPDQIKAVYRLVDRDPLLIFVDLVNMSDDDEAVMLARKLLTLLPPLTDKDWRYLHSLTDNTEDEEYSNQKLRSFFFRHLKQEEPPAARPAWIKDDLPSWDGQIPPALPSVKEAIELILNQLDSGFQVTQDRKDVKLDSLRETMVIHYSTALAQERTLMLPPGTVTEPVDDLSMFHQFGPSNSLYHGQPSGLCAKYGDCRMFLCTEMELMDEDGEEIDIFDCQEREIESWFRGRCDECGTRIAKLHYAVRVPLQYGGWRGCFCGWKCASTCVVEGSAEQSLLELIKDKLLLLGIRER